MQSVRKDEIMLSELDQKRIDHLYKLLKKEEKNMKNTKNIMWVVALIAVVVLIGVVAYGYFRKATFKAQNPIVTMEVENFGTIKMELYPDKAPESVSNFIALANRGFYNGTKFHRVVKDFMIQTGSKNGDGTTGATLGELKGTEDKNQYTITGEFLANGITNTLKFEQKLYVLAHNIADSGMGNLEPRETKSSY